MFGLGVGEIAIVVLIVVLFFGPKKLPQLGKGLGQAIREFKNAGSELHSESEEKKRKS